VNGKAANHDLTANLFIIIIKVVHRR